MPSYNEILKKIDQAINRFNRKIPAAQQSMYDEITMELKRLELRGGNVKTTVANLKIIAAIKNKMRRLILTPDYIAEVKVFLKAFNEVTKLQNEYWKSIEPKFKPKPLLKEIRKQAIGDAVKSLTESGIITGIEDKITEILRTNITTGGSYKALQKQLAESLTDTSKSDGILTKRVKQVTIDSIHQYNRQYTKAISDDLGYEFYAYQGSDIKTTRPFCDAMTDRRYFHVSEITGLLKANDLYYLKEGVRTKVPVYDKTGLPHGLIEGTDSGNFMVRAGGYNCGHAIRPVSERLIKAQAPEEYERIINSSEYKRWKL